MNKNFILCITMLLIGNSIIASGKKQSFGQRLLSSTCKNVQSVAKHCTSKTNPGCAAFGASSRACTYMQEKYRRREKR